MELKEEFEEAEEELLGVIDESLAVEISEIDQRESFVNVTVFKSIRIIFVIIFFFILLLLLVGFLLSRSILIPLKKIEDVSVEVSKGNFDLKSNIDSDDEFGHLSFIFDSMLDDIKKKFELEKYSKKLEEKVKERTKELDEKNKELERTLEDFYTLRITMQEKLELDDIKKENEVIKKS
ncbi:hypothetical protein A2331_00710 [Candidatus Falkowbacteria bacterium RIFOXYB2_FULL_34_18]|uniref:histidine kinase n=1 Tax=Candidatus Falkowbacteria bacterium RIFOXYD2_FULL_34_120 TaxID=1798007 RepID=A0A1F5TM74_9BACT|nr:MAG: hypothetical protein A2331_00710 [Candidatus Falkowbacteria bacterium RIFOXYB2_FULL_34_18]OGF29210.1 MAG: hypothetical protein A2500_06025 [Candidatus Falkowbacteria bacterium RIFOXYC12_FULL_34_55]OGF37748.1 MAG: hypothetical protein A2466_06355 [Candidatus Falkowbacteria bacterium RIFOXYC2_FULL_34_220]OGF38732.1 MAG: hypothetical protein A2515_01690 [Candidatus Falkowbacteria bacterium RIFOXYD12_FULL_34_57]OGF39966.1 MAG: hypothetical protein A2531_01945 [Candidatus Falkowbacteria bact